MVYLGHVTHGYHRNIAGPKVSQWKDGYRDFEDEYQMTKHLVEQINKYVKEDDILYHLGDFTFGGIDNIWNFRKQINCKNIHLILGNHDHHIENDKRLPNYTFKDVPLPAKSLFNSVQYVKTVKHGKNKFFLSHFAHRVWDKSHHGVIHLYGHSHASIDDNWGRSMDVGVDNAYRLFGKYRPFHLNEIVIIMNKREPLILDHHNSQTT